MLGGDGEAAVDGLDTERRDEPAVVLVAVEQQCHRGVGDAVGGVEVGFLGVVLDLDVHPHAGARIERLAETGYVLGQRRPIERRDEAAVVEVGVVVHHERPVGGAAHVELHRVGAHPPCRGERLEGVLTFRA